MNSYFLNEQQRQQLRESHPYQFDNVMKQYKTDLAANTHLNWGEEEWKKAFHWVGEKWFEHSQRSSLTEAWQKASEDFHRHYTKTVDASSIATDPIKNPLFQEDFEILLAEKLKRDNKGTRMIFQVFVGLVIWKILIIIIFQKACVAQ